MQIKFLGHGGAFATTAEGNTNACITINGKNLLIDFGVMSNIIWREEWKKSFQDIDALYISHCHLGDHCCLETFLFSRYFIPKLDSKTGVVVKPKLYTHPTVLEEVWQSYKPSMGVYRNEILHLTNFADCHGCSDFVFENIKFSLIQNQHIESSFGSKDAYGLTFTVNGVKIYWSSDAVSIRPKLIAWADIVFHDCETLHGAKSRVHAHYLDLRKLPEEMKRKMWLMHYGPHNLRASADGFAGFVCKNQEFKF